MPLPENNILFYWTAPNGCPFLCLFGFNIAAVKFNREFAAVNFVSPILL